MKKFLNKIGLFLLAIAVEFVLCYPIMLLWNWVVPEIFGCGVVTFWQMFAIEILFACLIRRK